MTGIAHAQGDNQRRSRSHSRKHNQSHGLNHSRNHSHGRLWPAPLPRHVQLKANKINPDRTSTPVVAWAREHRRRQRRDCSVLESPIHRSPRETRPGQKGASRPPNPIGHRTSQQKYFIGEATGQVNSGHGIHSMKVTIRNDNQALSDLHDEFRHAATSTSGDGKFSTPEGAEINPVRFLFHLIRGERMAECRSYRRA